MTFVMYIKFINETHLYWVFILSWGALQIIVTVLFHLILPQTNGYLITGNIFSLSEPSLAQEKSRERWTTRVGYFLRKGLSSCFSSIKPVFYHVLNKIEHVIGFSIQGLAL